MIIIITPSASMARRNCASFRISAMRTMPSSLVTRIEKAGPATGPAFMSRSALIGVEEFLARLALALERRGGLVDDRLQHFLDVGEFVVAELGDRHLLAPHVLAAGLLALVERLSELLGARRAGGLFDELLQVVWQRVELRRVHHDRE